MLPLLGLLSSQIGVSDDYAKFDADDAKFDDKDLLRWGGMTLFFRWALSHACLMKQLLASMFTHVDGFVHHLHWTFIGLGWTFFGCTSTCWTFVIAAERSSLTWTFVKHTLHFGMQNVLAFDERSLLAMNALYLHWTFIESMNALYLQRTLRNCAPPRTFFNRQNVLYW